MKRLHVSVNVTDLEQSVGFYATLFGSEPAVLKEDYAKWLLDDPSVNFVISTRGEAAGLNHVGIQVDEPAELAAMANRLKAAGEVTFDQEETTCCYAVSDKTWVRDPAGLRWETFFTRGDATRYGEDIDPEQVVAQVESTRCC